MNIDSHITHWQQRIDVALKNVLPKINYPAKHLKEAMHYTVLNGGKRIRPLLVYATGKIFGAEIELLDKAACAVELIHTYSLIHDDLPAMDNDDLRRGKPTCHKAFDEATAILAGDALQSLAFEILSSEDSSSNATTCLSMIDILTKACGADGMAGGQALDLAAVGKKLNESDIELIHSLKTGALIRASIKLGVLASHCRDLKQLTLIDNFSTYLGLAFQIHDDILDIESHTTILGKQQGADVALNKPTYPSTIGLANAKERLKKLHQDALAILKELDKPTELLQGLTSYIMKRHY